MSHSTLKTLAYGLAVAASLAGLLAAQISSPQQAKQGQAVYQEKCAACHGPDLEGGDHAPSLRGDEFWSSWDQKKARALYGRILTSMPPEDAGSLAEKDVIRIVAYLLQANGMPAGDKDVDGPDQLTSLTMEKPKK
jgi:mono/diheme cytochrome c family protein